MFRQFKYFSGENALLEDASNSISTRNYRKQGMIIMFNSQVVIKALSLYIIFSRVWELYIIKLNELGENTNSFVSSWWTYWIKITYNLAKKRLEH